MLEEEPQHRSPSDRHGAERGPWGTRSSEILRAGEVSMETRARVLCFSCSHSNCGLLVVAMLSSPELLLAPLPALGASPPCLLGTAHGAAPLTLPPAHTSQRYEKKYEKASAQLAAPWRDSPGLQQGQGGEEDDKSRGKHE